MRQGNTWYVPGCRAIVRMKSLVSALLLNWTGVSHSVKDPALAEHPLGE